MTKRPDKLYWIGERDQTGQPLEFFGAVPGVREPIPAMDLDAAWLADASEAQWDALDSPAGRRLYRRTEPESTKEKASASTGEAAASSATADRPSATSASGGTSSP